jgi:hypothetical protein
LWLAAKAGLVGAAFSIALAIRGRTVALDTDLLDNVTDGTLRLLIGVISAGVLLLLLACGILPSLKIGDANFSGSTLTWQMVLVIGFVGGFLERLVPDLLEKKNPQGNDNNTTAGAGAHTWKQSAKRLEPSGPDDTDRVAVGGSHTEFAQSVALRPTFRDSPILPPQPAA